MTKQAKIVNRALEMAVKALWKEWKPQKYCEAEGCGESQKSPCKCGKDDKFCHANIEAHFIRKAKEAVK